MKFYKLIVSYDGTDYHGWQMQPDRPTVVSALRKSFARVFAADATIVGASRTDAGVHALGQVALVRTTIDVSPDQLMWAWNNRLPADIKICLVQRVDENFHPQRDVLQKTYQYKFFTEKPCPLKARYGAHVRKIPNIEKLNECLQIFVGTHDFRSFCTGTDMGDDTTRTIDSIDVQVSVSDRAYIIEVKGKSFLRYMIRRIVGASLAVASKSYMPIEYLQKVLQEKNPRQLLPTAPARGLTLCSIVYKKTENNE